MSPLPSNEDIYRSLCDLLQLDTADVSVQFDGQDPILPTPHRITDACSAALACAGAAMTKLAQHRGVAAVDAISVDSHSSALQLSAAFYTSLNGVPVTRLFEDASLFSNSDFYRTRDDSWVFLLLTYPRLRDVACDILNCPPGREHYAKAIATWDAKALEQAICERRGCCIALRTQDEWRATEQGRALLKQPLVRMENIPSSSPPSPLSKLSSDTPALPLTGVRVLDNTHVIAGPMLARMAAEHGADVLHISSPEHADPAAMLNETGLGKRNAFCDLTEEAGQKAFWSALDSTDVYVCSYRGMHRKGFSPQELLKRKPNLIAVEITAWGDKGPWADEDRGGFDQLACTATGFSAFEGGDGQDARPSLPPTYLLNDYLAAILSFAAVGSALLRRDSNGGGGYIIHVNLASVVMWVQDLGTFPRQQVADLPKLQRPLADKDTKRLASVKGPNGTAVYLPTCIRYSNMRPHFRVGAEPSGASLMTWTR